MPEVAPNTVGPFYEHSHKRFVLVLQVVFGPGGDTGVNPVLQVSIKVLVGVKFRGIGRKIEEWTEPLDETVS